MNERIVQSTVICALWFGVGGEMFLCSGLQGGKLWMDGGMRMICAELEPRLIEKESEKQFWGGSGCLYSC